ncbi:MAG: hypothetical protein MJZ45_02215 [Bacteroidales bacterium]|nr:hypothetical protein [Bacteroidales bacterium]
MSYKFESRQPLLAEQAQHWTEKLIDEPLIQYVKVLTAVSSPAVPTGLYAVPSLPVPPFWRDAVPL